MRGEVVGVTTAIISQGQGIGFAVPINLVKDLLPNLLDNGRVERGWLGLSVAEARVDGKRVALVTDVFSRGPAERAGVQTGDQVLGVGGKSVTSYLQLLRRIALQAPGTAVKLSLLRKGKPIEVNATLASSPSRETIQALAGEGRIDALGLVVRPVAPAPGATRGGVLIAAVLPGGPAELAGLQAGDVLVEANKRPVSEIADLKAALDEGEADAVVLLKFARGDSQRYVALKRR
jgi:serine protease Do